MNYAGIVWEYWAFSFAENHAGTMCTIVSILRIVSMHIVQAIYIVTVEEIG